MSILDNILSIFVLKHKTTQTVPIYFVLSDEWIKYRRHNMKKVFVKTNNVKRFITMMNNLQRRAEGEPGMGLVYGEPGLGKTYAITWWPLQNDAVFVRCANNMNARWLLEELAEELAEIPYSKFANVFNQVITQLLKQPRPIIIDEIDYLTIWIVFIKVFFLR